MFKLKKWINSWANRDFRNYTNENWSVIEQGLSLIHSLLFRSKDELNTRIDNLILNSGDSSNEVIDMRVDKNGKVYDLAGKRITAIENDISQREINVINLGAIGNGIVDDTMAIQQALDSAKYNGQASIIIPAGTYRLTKTLVIYRNTRIRMDPNTILLRGHSGNIMMNGEKDAEYVTYSGQGNLNIEGGILDGNVKEFASGFTQFDLARGSNIIIKNVTFKDTISAHAIDMNACKNVFIEKCRFIGFKVIGSSDGNLREAIQISEHTKDGFPAFGIYDGTPCENITIENCYFGNSDTEGMGPWPVALGNHAAVNDIFNRNIKVFKNTFEGMTYAGVRIFKYQDTWVKDNAFISCNIGVLVNNAAPNSYSSKNIDGTQSGRSQSGRNSKIQSNTFKNCKLECVRITSYVQEDNDSRFEDVIISDNTFLNDGFGISQSAAISINWGKNIRIKDNTIKNFYRGIHFNFVGNADITNNIFENLVAESVFTNEFDAEYRKQDHTYNIKVNNNTIIWCGGASIFLQYSDGIEVLNNKIYASSMKGNGLYNAIFIGNNCKNGVVENNDIKNHENGTKPRYAVEISGSCINIRTFNNKGDGTLGKVITSSANNFEGFLLHNTAGTDRLEIGYNFFNSFKWIDAVLQNGATAYSIGLRPQYGKDEFGTVYIRGATNNGTLGKAFFTLPEGFRPSKKQTYLAVKGGTNATARISISEATGEVIVETTSNTEKPTEYITFDFSFKSK